MGPDITSRPREDVPRQEECEGAGEVDQDVSCRSSRRAGLKDRCREPKEVGTWTRTDAGRLSGRRGGP